MSAWEYLDLSISYAGGQTMSAWKYLDLNYLINTLRATLLSGKNQATLFNII